MSPSQGISTFLPFLVTGVFCFLEKLLFTKDHHSLAQEPSQLLTNAFKNYFIFIWIMIAFKLIITLNKLAFSRKSNEKLPQNAFFFENNTLETEPMNSSKIKQSVVYFCKLMLTYTLLFGCFQFVFTLAFHITRTSPSQALITSSIIQPSSRHLEQITIPEDFMEPEKLIPSPYLNPGEILGSINPGPIHGGATRLQLLVSKDANTLYTYQNYTLGVFDISNPRKPSNLSSLLIGPGEAFLLLSPNEEFLYILTYNQLFIINVTNKASPSLVVASETFEWRSGINAEVYFYFSMVITSDGRTLWTVNNGYLQAWDVTDPKNPEIYYAETVDPKYRGTLAISKDDKRLVVGKEDGFKIYNTTIPRRAHVLKTVETDGRVYSIAFSHDETRLLIGLQNNLERNMQIYAFSVAIFDIADIDSPTLLISQKLNNDASYGILSFHTNEKYAFFNTRREFKMINILDGEQTTLFSTFSDVKGSPFTATPDNKINIVYISGAIHIMKLNIDITPKSLLHFKQNSLQVIDDMDFERRKVMEISKDGKNLYLVRMNTSFPSYAVMVPYERKSNATLEKLNPSSNLDARVSEELNDDGQWLFAVGKNISVLIHIPKSGSALFLLNLADKNKTYPVTQNRFALNQRIPAIAMTNDGKSLVFVNHFDDFYTKITKLRLNIVTWDLNAMKLSSSLSNFEMPYSICHPFSVMKTNQDDSLLFYANCDLLIYNIKDPSAPILELSLSLNMSQTYAFILSKDERTLFLLGSDSSSSSLHKLLILNISNPRSPQILSTTFIEQALFSESTESLELNSDETTLFIGFLGGILQVDVRTLTQPTLFGFNYFLDQMYTPRFTDNATMLYTSSFKGVTAYDFSSQHILSFKNSEFKIGGSYSVLLNVLKLNNNKKFDFMTKKHKFLKVTLLEQNSASSLPNWIIFDKERSLLRIEPHLPSHHGTYKISVTLTTKVQSSAFTELVDDAESLMLDLTRSGYLDSKGYLSGDFDLSQGLRIDPKYKKLEMDILAILSKSYIQAIGEISVISSLSLSETKPLKISTFSKNTVYVAIQLDHEKGITPPFLTKSLSSLKPNIDNKKSLLRLEGLLENVNEALKEIVVDLNGLSVCDGVITINDGINPPITSHHIPSLSNYLHINEKPHNNLKNLQEQIDANPFYTGVYSAMLIDSSTFTDKNNLTLEYSLELEDPTLGLPPAWITIRGLNLMTTPPESYTKFSYPFVLRISNEFQNITAPFTLKTRISFNYAVKLLFTFLGYCVSLIGAVYSVNRAYNILARKYYRHPRSFKLKVGEEINDSKIFSVSFINNEMAKIKSIFNALEKYVSQNHNQMSLVEYFVDSQFQVLDKEKVMATLDSLENEDYQQADAFSTRIIQQLIINKIVAKQLAARQNASTKDIFEKIKNKWMDLVTVSIYSPSQFVINSEALAEELSRFSLGYGGESLDETHFESSDLLIKKNKLNMDLLANAIISHAFDYQNIDVDLILIDVISYKKIRGKTLYHLIKKFLLKNLKPFVFLNKREIGCGIEYKTENNTLHFFGKLTHELKNGTIVVHLKNHRGRILREFWIIGENTEIQLQNYLHNHDSENL